MICLCPDGTYANMVGNQIVCPPRAQAQPAVGAYCSNGGTCGVGYRCSWMPGKCVPEGKIDCGSYYCELGFKCSSAKCIAGLTSAQIADRAATPTQPPNIEQRFKTNVDRVIKALRDIGDWIRDGAAKPFPSVPFDILVFFGSGVLLVAMLLINVMPLSRREQVLTHEGPKHPETGRVPSEGHAAWSIAPVRPGATSASEPSSEHRDAWGVSEPSSRHNDSPWAVHSKADVKKSPQVERDVALERDGGADKVRGEVPSAPIDASDHKVTTTSPTGACGRTREAPMDTVAAQQAMKIADLYIKETRNIDLKDKTEVRAARTTLVLASEQLAKAYRADPDATVEIDGKTFDVPFLRSLMLIRQAETWLHFDINKSISLADQATKADPLNAMPFHILGVLHMEAHNPKHAQAALTRAAQLAPDDADILKDLDRAQHMGGLSVAAYKAAETGITLIGILSMILKVVVFPFYIVFRVMAWFEKK